MENKFISKNRNIISFLVAIFVSAGIAITIKSDLNFEGVSSLNSVLFAFNKSLSGNRLLGLVYFLAVLLLTNYFQTKFTDIKSLKGTAIFSVIFSFCQFLGDGYTQDYSSGMAKAIYVLMLYRYFCLTVFVFLLSFALLNYISEYLTNPKMDCGKISLVKVAILLYAAHVICYLVFFPGVVGKDASIQAMLYFGEHTGNAGTFYKLSPWYGVREYTISSHHPFLTTYLFGGVFDLGYRLGSPSIGVAIYDFIQMTLTVVMEVFVINYFNKSFEIPLRIKRIAVMFFAFFPPLTVSAITMNKDNIYAVIHALLLIALFEVVRTNGEVFKKKKFVSAVFVLNCLYILTRGQGIYILFILTVVLLVKYRKYWLQIGISFLVSILFCQFFINGFVAGLLNIAPGGKQEVLGVFFQQTATYVVKYGDEVTEEEKGAISQILDYDAIPEKYRAINQDGVKFTYNQQATTEDLKNYFIVWGKMFTKHPLCYVSSVLHNIYSMYYMDRNSNYAYLIIPTDQCEQTRFQYLDFKPFKALRQTTGYLITTVQRMPGVSYFMSIAAMFWMSVVCIVITIRNKKEYLVPLLLDILLILTFFICPVMSYRYLLPLTLTLPIKLMLASFAIREGKNKGE